VWIDDLLRVLAAVRARSAHVCLAPWCFGVKLGVPAVGDGDAVDQLLLLAPPFGLHADVAQAAASRLSVADAVPLPAGDDRFVETDAGRAFLAADALRWSALPSAFRALSARLNAMMLAQLPRVTAPLTAFFPTRDRVTDGKAGRRLMAELGHPARSIDGSHCFFLEQPDAAADLVGGAIL
jgi:pimeloyl-ACP methyl ester carboxylesterase